MKHFKHMQASSAKEAASATEKGTAVVMAGGTDLLGTLKDEILPTYPETVVDLKAAAGMDGISEDGDVVVIGALAKLAAVAESDAVREGCAALAEACARAASPTIRHMGTIGGNVCQMHRCWYFRVPDDRFHCRRKGGDWCPARIGDNRYHSIFGDQDGCYAASSHDTAPALVALGASVKTTKREVPAEEFFRANGVRSNVLEDGEVVTDIRVPKAAKSAFLKFALRKSIDFPVVNCAAAQLADGSVRVALGGVYPAPVRSTAAEAAVAGGVSADSAARAADAAVEDCKPLAKNAYKVEIARTLVKRTLSELVG
ncbi:molybdopterin dehydrogenase [Rubneribacter badeniensis]|uniref:FAD binding domain-containing protein n=1 Tax=Rubneribacter badeniensis TaxID=2070688 RepID=A0A2K2U5T1_9ACTN|nr:FAD binding domain-containing protein [Rubneribacter badeniensis]PNV65667.1 molybdopterin dehydrogenase [Rubneribacter badeniensis]CVH77038.1 4-hydroxybenzoyl-CoA reductase subunit beta [Coriobacteriaceae bacterium CHKCI002]HJH43494.1 FAD binding domain-containing protein [Rubneribacter badeniensis]